VKKISTNKNKALLFDPFTGIDVRSDVKNELGCSYVSNFRIKENGTLEKRYGYKLLTKFNNNIRAIWTGKINGVFKAYALVGNSVMLIHFDIQSEKLIGKVSTSYGDAEFFYYRSSLYLIDGTAIYTVTDTSISAPHGYVPLIGKNWHERTLGEINEPRNILHNRARISYIIHEDDTEFIKTDAPISSVDLVYVNGTQLDGSRYQLSVSPCTILINGLSKGDLVEIGFTYAEANDPSELFSNTRAAVFGGINTSRPFLWGGRNKSKIFNALYVNDHEAEIANKFYPQSDLLYFPEGYEFTVGDGRYPISCASRHFDRLLIFTEGGAWMADSSACGLEPFPLMNINSSIGVSSPYGAVLIGNEPCTVGANSIYRWRANTDELNDCNAYSISRPVDELLPADFFTDAVVFADKRKDEILFASPFLEDKILVYNTLNSTWVFFEGISADRFIECDKDIGFVSGGSIYVFDSDCSTDNGNDIVAVYKSNLITFGDNTQKHLSRITAKYNGSMIKLSVFFDGSTAADLTALFNGTEKFSTVEQRLSSKRFRSMRFMLKANGTTKQKIHSLCFRTR
jgi:hypothetical protein